MPRRKNSICCPVVCNFEAGSESFYSHFSNRGGYSLYSSKVLRKIKCYLKWLLENEATPLQATVWISVEHARVTECPLSELSDFGQSQQTCALDERTTKGQQFNW